MKLLFYSILIVPFVIFSCGGNEDQANQSEDNSTDSDTTANKERVKPPENTFDIVSERVGVFYLGEEVPDPLPEELKSRQFLEFDVNEAGETIEHKHNVIFNVLEDIVELIMQKDTSMHHEDKVIEEIIVLSNYYQTADSVGVGTSIEEFEAVYPDMSVWYDKIHDNYLVETGGLLGVQFIFNELDVKRKAKGSADHQEINTSYIKKGAEIEKIRVH